MNSPDNTKPVAQDAKPVEATKIADKEYALTLSDLQKILDYFSGRPAGEVFELIVTLRRARPLFTNPPIEPVKEEVTEAPVQAEG